MNRITTSPSGKLLVPDTPVIPFIEGDGVGAEITPVMQAIVDAAVKVSYQGKRAILWKEILAGEKAFRETGSWLPEATMNAFRDHQGAPHHPHRRRYPFAECGIASGARPLHLPPAGSLVQRGGIAR